MQICGIETINALVQSGLYDKLFALCSASAANGAAIGMWYLSVCYRDGLGTPPDKNNSIIWCMKARDAGYPDAISALDTYTADEILSACADLSDRGDPYASCYLANQYISGIHINRDRKKACELFSQAHDLSASDMHSFAELLYRGTGCAKDTERAIDLYISASEQGCMASQLALSRIQSETAYVRHLSEAADGLNPTAQYKLGRHYEYGLCTERIPPYAFSLYTAAQQAKNVDAAFRLGIMYEYGTDSPQNRKKTYAMYSEAARSGNPRYRIYLAQCLEKGIGTDKNIKAAVKIYLHEALSGSITASYLLADCCIRGLCTDSRAKAVFDNFQSGRIPYDPKEATAYTDDAYAGYPREQFFLGLIYGAYGDTAHDTDAYEMFTYAAENGYAPAYYALGQCFENGTGVKCDMQAARRYYKAAADAGHALACYRLGLAELGSDDEYAAELFSCAAQKNHAPSIVYLSYMNDTGTGVEENRSLAYQLAEKARHLPMSISDKDIDTLRKDAYSHPRSLYIAALMAECLHHRMDEALSYMRTLSDKGDPLAIFRLGDMYALGRCTEKNEKKAFSLFKQASDMGHSEATYRLGMCFVEGTGTEKDLSAAFRYFGIASAMGNPSAMTELAGFYETGCCCEQDSAEAYELYRRAAKGGNEKALEKIKTRMHTLKMLGINIHAAKNGDVKASYELGMAYLRGGGIEKSEADAYKWLGRAADGGDINALYEIGCAYESGAYYTRDPKLAAEYFEKAAAGGHEGAKQKLDAFRERKQLHSLYKKIANDKNADRSKLLTISPKLRRIADEGTPWAMYLYGLFCEMSGSTSKNLFKALTYYKKAAAKGHRESLYELGEHVLTGRGAGRDSANAYEYFRQSAEKGYAPAEYRMGCCYEMGAYTKKNTYMAQKWYEKAAKSHYPAAMYRLARLHESKGASPDTVIAMYEGCAKKSVLAKYRLSLMYMRSAQTHARGMELCREAAQDGNVYAMIKCGMTGLSERQAGGNMRSAYAYLQNAANAGSPFAKFLVGMCAERGIGTSVSLKKAMRMYTEAARYNTPQAFYRLGRLTDTSDPALSSEYLKKAAFLGSAQAKKLLLRTHGEHELNEMLFGSDGSTELAIDESTEDDHMLYLLGLHTEQGIGRKKDTEKALRIYRKAAEYGNADAMYRICMMYEAGCIEYDGEDADNMCISAFFAGNGYAAARAEIFELY